MGMNPDTDSGSDANISERNITNSSARNSSIENADLVSGISQAYQLLTDFF